MTEREIQHAPPHSVHRGALRGLTPMASMAVRNYGGLIALGILVIFVIQQNDKFLTTLNLANMGDQWAAVLIMAVGFTIVMAGSGFDLSIGSTFAFSAVICVQVSQDHSPIVAVVIAIAVGAVIGLANGLLVSWANINPFVVTLAMLQIVRGIALLYSNGRDELLSERATAKGSLFYTLSSDVAGVPVGVIVAGGFVVVGGCVLEYTSYGRSIHAIGGNYEASYLSGLRVDAIRASTYVVCGVTAAVAGVMFTARIGSAVATEGDFIMFTVIAAVLIGGITGWGGPTAMWRAVAGTALLAVLQNYFNYKNVNGFWQLVVTGVVILVAVGADSFTKRPHRRSLRARFALLRGRGMSLRETGGTSSGMRDARQEDES